MITPETILCDRCHSVARVMTALVEGGAIRPKVAMRGYDMHVFIACPKCGECEQPLPTDDDIDRFDHARPPRKSRHLRAS